MTASRTKLPHSLELLLRVELEQAIEQANLGTFDTFVAKKYLIEQVPLADIAAEVGYDRSAIGKRIPVILFRVQNAAERMFPANSP